MSDATNIKAIVIHVHSEHGIRCSAAQEQRLAREFNALWSAGELSRVALDRIISTLPSRFFSENGLDSPKQYADLLWDAVSVQAEDLRASTSTSVTHFHGPVQTQILQTGANSRARIVQTAQQNLSYSNAIHNALRDVRKTIAAEIADEDNQAAALKIVSDAEIESSKPNPNRGKIQKCLTALTKWTGERLTKAVDAAIAVGVKYGLEGQASSS